MENIKVQGKDYSIIVDSDVAGKLEGCKIYEQYDRNADRIGYRVIEPNGRRTGLVKFLYGKRLNQLKKGNDYRRSNLKNASSKYLGIYKDGSTGAYCYSFDIDGKKYAKSGYRTESDAALAHDRLIKQYNLDREYITDLYNNKLGEPKQQTSNSNNSGNITKAIKLHINVLNKCVMNEMSKSGEVLQMNNSIYATIEQSNLLAQYALIANYIANEDCRMLSQCVATLPQHNEIKVYFDKYIKTLI